jgi:uncharacterized protein YndB with AHSA1/START domain
VPWSGTSRGGDDVAKPERLVDDPGDVVREIWIEAAPEAVFEYFTDPAKVVRWIGQRAEVEPRVGGAYRLTIDGNTTAGELVQLEPPRRVAFTWGWEGGGPVPPGSSTVVVDLEPDRLGTLVRLTHRGLPEEAREIHGHGWDRFLPALASAAGG